LVSSQELVGGGILRGGNSKRSPVRAAYLIFVLRLSMVATSK
jgi:hypothetical protein